MPRPVRGLRKSAAFFRDLAEVNRRRIGRINDEIFREPYRGRYPRYYLQNFHFQSGGYLSGDSARLYDHQVEVLFTGGADAMRRQVQVPQIGRASCRGRVCQFVQLSVVAGSLNKKKEYEQIYNTATYT